MRQIVLAPDFLDDNYLSTEFRVPVTLLQTNACSPLATNAIGGNIWDNFSSQSYKDLPSVGQITWYHPYTGEPQTYTMPAGGRGYTRPPSLVSLWSTAPFLLNNSVGHFESSPSVEARMRSFQDVDRTDAVAREAREGQPARRQDSRARSIARRSRLYLRVRRGYLPDFLQRLPTDSCCRRCSAPTASRSVRFRPARRSACSPTSICSSKDPNPGGSTRFVTHGRRSPTLLLKVVKDLAALPANATDEQARETFKNLVDPLLEVSKCPDFIVNRGHLFGTMLPDADKRALIEFLKTF